MQGLFKFVSFGLLLALITSVAAAAPRYVSDELSINLRRGPGTDYRITELLNAGARVELLEQASGWSKVRTQDSEVGFVLTRFLSDSPAAREQLASMQQRVESLKSENTELKKELAQALEGSSELGELKRDLVADNKQLKQQLERIKQASANAVRISEENQRFREKLLSLESEMERLRHENSALQSRREGMKIGALVLVGGIVIGLILPLFRRRSKNAWDSL